HLLRTRLDGALSADRTARLQIVSAELRGAVQLTGNDAPILSGSTIHGALACSGNTPAPADLGVPNPLRGAGGGQCDERREGLRGKRYEAVQHLAEGGDGLVADARVLRLGVLPRTVLHEQDQIEVRAIQVQPDPRGRGQLERGHL